jgi:hypothetical protein
VAGAFSLRFAVQAYFHNREIMITLPVGASSSKGDSFCCAAAARVGSANPAGDSRTVVFDLTGKVLSGRAAE